MPSPTICRALLHATTVSIVFSRNLRRRTIHILLHGIGKSLIHMLGMRYASKINSLLKGEQRPEIRASIQNSRGCIMQSVIRHLTRRISVTGFAATLVFLLAITANQAQAGLISLSITTTPSSGTISIIDDAAGNSAEIWYSEVISFDPVSVAAGDQIGLEVHFGGGEEMTLESLTGDFFSGREEIGFRIRPLPGISVAGQSTLTTLFGLSGDLDATLPNVNNFTTGNQLSGIALTDFTDTFFSFDGFLLDTTYSTLDGGPVTVSSIELFAMAERIGITTIPEPGTLVLLGIGLLGLGARRRRAV